MTPVETPQDREDRITQRILAIGCLVICAVIVVALLFREIPDKNEIMIGTVVGFIFGNMVGPVYRKMFGGPDAGTRQQNQAQNEVLKTAVEKAATTPAVVADTVVVEPKDTQK